MQVFGKRISAEWMIASGVFLVGVTVMIWFISTHDIENLPNGGQRVAVYILGAAALLGTTITPKTPLLIPLAAFLGVGAGVVADAFMDIIGSPSERNLWPFEVIIWWAWTAPGIIVGFALGSLLKYGVRKSGRNAT